MKRVVVFALLLALLFSITPPMVHGQGAVTSGTITVYTALEDDLIKSYLTTFVAKYPNIKLNFVRDSTGIITARLIAEKDHPQADVVWGVAASSLLVLDSMGVLLPYAPAGLDRVNTSFREAKNPPAWVGIDEWESAFCINTVELKNKKLPVPTSWKDLLNPAYKDLIVMPDPSASGTGFLSVSGILQVTEQGYDLIAGSMPQMAATAEAGANVLAYKMEPKKPLKELDGWKYLDALDNNIAGYHSSGSKPCKMAGTGEAVIGISFGYRGVTQAKNGEPILTVFPSEGSGWDIEANALMKKAEIKPAARTFLDWAITDDVMKTYAKSYPFTSVPTGSGVPEGYPKDPIKQLIKNDFYWAAANRDAILKEWQARYGTKLQK